ncbi:MAG TPA: DMT family transporter [Solirubrobacteraceae bacterium]
MIAILGGLGAAVAWALSTLCSSRSSRLIAPLSVVAWVMLVGLVVAAPPAALDGIPRALHGSTLVWFVLAGAGNVIGLVLTYHALRLGQVALVSPLVSTEGAIAAVIAIVAGESLAPGVGVTLGLIAAGVCLASVSRPAVAAEDAYRHPVVVALAAAAALAFGASLYATGRAGTSLPASWVALSARLFGVVALTLPLALRGRLQLTRRAAKLVAASGVAEVVGFYSYTLGSRHGIAVAAVLSSQFGALSLLGAYVLFGERLTRLQLTGVAGVIVGVAVLSGLRA